jgi:hypothetical protein
MQSTDRGFLDTVVGLVVAAHFNTHVANSGVFASAERRLP